MAITTAARHSSEEKLVNALIVLMESGTAPWRRPWDRDNGGHHLNLLSGRRYRGGNPALLSIGMQLRGSPLPYWCGFAEARAQGLFPRRGAQAAYILRPQVLHRGGPPGRACRLPDPSRINPPGVDDKGPGARSSGAVTDDSRGEGRIDRLVLYRPMAVFNAADLEGPSRNELIRTRQEQAARNLRPEPDRLESAESVLRRWPVTVIHGGAHACYSPHRDQIHLPDRHTFHNSAAHLATWAHEAIHSTGHPSRLARDLSGVPGRSNEQGRAYAHEELVAELGAVLLGDRLEIGSDCRNHAAYLSHWIDLLRESPRLLLRVISQARRAADLISPEVEAPEPLAPSPSDSTGMLNAP